MSKINNIQNLASPNRIIWAYFGSLRALVQEVEALEDKEGIQKKTILCVFMGVAIVETFLNLYFRQLVEETKYQHYREQLLKELDENTSLELKIKDWPKRLFSKGVNFGSGIGQRFIALKQLRNNLMHFKSSYETVKTFDGEITGLANLADYETLDQNIAKESVLVAEAMIAEIFKLNGITEIQVVHWLHLWTGKVPV